MMAPPYAAPDKVPMRPEMSLAPLQQQRHHGGALSHASMSAAMSREMHQLSAMHRGPANPAVAPASWKPSLQQQQHLQAGGRLPVDAANRLARPMPAHGGGGGGGGGMKRPQVVVVDTSLYSHYPLLKPLGAVISNHGRWRNMPPERAARQMTLNLASHCVFGDDVMAQCTLSGWGGRQQLPQDGMELIKSVVSQYFQGCFTSDKWESVWSRCVESIRDKCKGLRSKDKYNRMGPEPGQPGSEMLPHGTALHSAANIRAADAQMGVPPMVGRAVDGCRMMEAPTPVLSIADDEPPFILKPEPQWL
ncbi:PREDICTED: uncharacterized protein LOC106806814 [Priapulus caudatus]|uniref:Uncharacterized protein LOC106806814 n=1 Tax=Priapulus caudatus TaxID=37621 RepID=A0ABM1DWT1_PRICU|nr:PREDICTED: uncharacterized protein LOC106806814 [Priapulus caudatus]